MTDRLVSTIDAAVTEFWGHVVDTCNRIISQANVYGFEFMDLPEPNVYQVSKALDSFVCPFLDTVTRIGDFSPESGIRIANIRQYNLHLREVVLALEEGNQENFKVAIEKLSSESMIFGKDLNPCS